MLEDCNGADGQFNNLDNVWQGGLLDAKQDLVIKYMKNLTSAWNTYVLLLHLDQSTVFVWPCTVSPCLASENTHAVMLSQKEFFPTMITIFDIADPALLLVISMNWKGPRNQDAARCTRSPTGVRPFVDGDEWMPLDIKGSQVWFLGLGQDCT